MNEINWNLIAEKLAEGKDIDWHNLKGLSTNDQLILEQLSSIEKISKVFTKNYKSKDINNKEVNQLFLWGHLQVVEKIGEGSFGEVYRAYDPILDRDVALKLFKRDDNLFQTRYLIQEAKRLAKVRNEYVLAIHGANICDNKVGIWSDLIVGSNLSKKSLQQQNDHKNIINVALEISSALEAVHKSGIIHGDVKLSNIMFHQAHKKHILMDFGAGVERKDVERNDTEIKTSELKSKGFKQKQKSENLIIGTPLYMAPELFNNQHISTATDVYAFGVLLFKLASGQYPIKARNFADIHAAHKKHNYLSLADFKTEIPASFRQLINAMLSVDANCRPNIKQIKQKLDWIKSAPERRKKRFMVTSVIVALLTGIILSSIGFYYSNESKKTAIIEKDKAQAVNEFLQNMLSSATNLGKGKEVKITDMLDFATRDLENNFENKPQIKAATLEAIGLSYGHLVLPSKSIQYLEQGLKLKKQWLAKDSPELLETQLKLVYAYRMNGEIDKSTETITQVLNQASKNPAKNKAIIDLAQIRLADNYNAKGDYQKAQSLYESVLLSLEKSKDLKYNTAYLAYQGLSENYLSQSLYSKAYETLEQALKEYNLWPQSSIKNLYNLRNIQVRILLKLGQFDLAESIYTEVLNLTDKHYGKENILYLKNLINFAGLYQERGKYSQAMQVLQQAQELSPKILDDDNELSIKTNIILANTKVSMGLLNEGEQIMQSTLKLARKVQGDSHIDTLILEYNLAELLNKNNKFKESLTLGTLNYHKMSQKLGNKHLYTLLSLDNLSVSLTGLKQYQKAENQFLKIIVDMKATIGTNSPYLILVQQHLVNLYIESKQHQSALAQLQILIDLQSQTLGSEHTDTLVSKKLLHEMEVMN